MAVTMSQAFFLAIIFETLFYGAFMPVFAFLMYLQWERRKRSKTTGSILVFCFSVILFLFISVQWLLHLWGTYNIFMTVDTGHATDLAFTNWSAGSIVLFALYEVQVWMGDVILVYRLYCVSQKKIRPVIFPCITCVITMVCAINLLHSIAVENSLDHASVVRARIWAILTFLLTLTENTYCAAMIAFHIWRTRRDVQDLIQTELSPILKIFIESAGLWIVLMFTEFFLYLAHTPVWSIILHLTVPALGICFCIMTARLYLLTHDGFESRHKTSGLSSSAVLPMEFAHPIPVKDPHRSPEMKRTAGSFEESDIIIIA